MHNEAKSSGGAVRWRTNDGTINIAGSKFTDNKANDGGGAMWWISAKTVVSITDCSFTRNIAVTKDYGGALMLTTASNTTTAISGNLFDRNWAYNTSGGVISISGSNQAPIIMSHNHFECEQSCKQKRRSCKFLKEKIRT